ncbi:NADP-specific glutamate dehydrogenase [Candidatus Bathyarchaeota archaeon]|nr:MAG: NADP-specific glutamate dehydrogenase [Candidatus Bathyarchaeota archaeon]
MDKYIESVYQSLLDKDPLQKEFHQAALEVLETLEPVIKKYPVFKEHKILERIVEPERIIQFRVPWKDRNGEIQINRGYRVQYNSAIGPYKGGFRFHPTVYLGLMKFLGFEQTFKNSLTTLPMGGSKGGSDFDPKGKNDNEVENFCHSFMFEMYRHIGQFTDVPAGDIGVGGREIGYLYAAYRKITNEHGTGVLTGKGYGWGGSLVRPEATGYGNVYFAQEMLKTKGESFKGKKVLVSGSGNVAQHAVHKAMQLGAIVASMSDSEGAVHIPDGMTEEQWKYVMELKNVKRGRISEFADKYNLEYVKGGRVWQFGGKIALPCATQNELDKKDAEKLIDAGVIAVGEGANMPTTPDAVALLIEKGILFSPGKASNAGGVATSGLEMSQNSGRLFWSAEEVDQKLHGIMISIHKNAYDTAKEFGQPGNYVMGANIAGFLKVAKAMVAQGMYA